MNLKLEFSRKDVLKRHINGKHEMKKPHKCENCEKCFSQKTHLKEHISTVHEKKKNFTCEICNARFTERKSVLGT